MSRRLEPSAFAERLIRPMAVLFSIALALAISSASPTSGEEPVGGHSTDGQFSFRFDMFGDEQP